MITTRLGPVPFDQVAAIRVSARPGPPVSARTTASDSRCARRGASAGASLSSRESRRALRADVEQRGAQHQPAVLAHDIGAQQQFRAERRPGGQVGLGGSPLLLGLRQLRARRAAGGGSTRSRPGRSRGSAAASSRPAPSCAASGGSARTIFRSAAFETSSQTSAARAGAAATHASANSDRGEQRHGRRAVLSGRLLLVLEADDDIECLLTVLFGKRGTPCRGPGRPPARTCRTGPSPSLP